MLDSVLGSTPETWNGGEGFVLERLGGIVDYCASRGVVLALEPHIGDGLCEQPEKVVELLRQVDSPHLRLNFDISHFEVSGIPTGRSVELLAPWAAHTHVKDQRGRVPEFEFLIPGEGPFDYCDYLRRMAAAGYGGCVTAEVSMAVHRRPGYDPMAAATLCHRTLPAGFPGDGTARLTGREAAAGSRGTPGGRASGGGETVPAGPGTRRTASLDAGRNSPGRRIQEPCAPTAMRSLEAAVARARPTLPGRWARPNAPRTGPPSGA